MLSVLCEHRGANVVSKHTILHACLDCNTLLGLSQFNTGSNPVFFGAHQISGQALTAASKKGAGRLWQPDRETYPYAFLKKSCCNPQQVLLVSHIVPALHSFLKACRPQAGWNIKVVDYCWLELRDFRGEKALPLVGRTMACIAVHHHLHREPLAVKCKHVCRVSQHSLRLCCAVISTEQKGAREVKREPWAGHRARATQT